MMEDSVCVVTVTYGNRLKYLEEVLEKLKEINEIRRVVIVDNGSDPEIVSNDPRVKVIRFNENKGSALGFKTGIERAVKYNDCDFVWLLDDDNSPDNEALCCLLEKYKELSEQKKSVFGLLSLRENRKDFVNVAKYDNSNEIFPCANSFFGFHIKNIFKIIIKKLNGRFKNNVLPVNSYRELVKVPVAYYGGFFFHKSLISKIGLPNELFYLYCDDHEFTYRLNRHGGSIYLVPSSKVVDIDDSWYLKDKKGFLNSLLTTDSEFRVYYSLRNRIYFEKESLNFKGFLYKLNKFCFLSLVKMYSMVLNKKDRFNLIKMAVKDGENGLLGKADI